MIPLIVQGIRVGFFLSLVSILRFPHPSVLRCRVLEVLSLCYLFVSVGCPLEVHLVIECLRLGIRLYVVAIIPGLSRVP